MITFILFMLACSPINIAKKTDGKTSLLPPFCQQIMLIVCKKEYVYKAKQSTQEQSRLQWAKQPFCHKQKTQNTDGQRSWRRKVCKSTSIAFCRSNADWLCQNT